MGTELRVTEMESDMERFHQMMEPSGPPVYSVGG